MIGLNIDTSILRSSVSVAQQANEAISEATSLLNAITVHEDWMCTDPGEKFFFLFSNPDSIRKI